MYTLFHHVFLITWFPKIIPQKKRTKITYIELPVYSTLGITQSTISLDHSLRLSIFMYSMAGMN